MKHLVLTLLCFILNTNISFLSAQTLVLDQDENYPLYTNADISFDEILNIWDNDTNNNPTISIVKLRDYKNYLEPFVEQNDPSAVYLYGDCHCLLVLWTRLHGSNQFDKKNLSDTIGISVDTSIVLNQKKCTKYLKKADSLNVAWASWSLYNFYRSKESSDGSINYDLALHYLNKAEKTGGNQVKSNVYYSLAHIYLPNNPETVGTNLSFPLIEYNIDSGFYYLLKSYDTFSYHHRNKNCELGKEFEYYHRNKEAVEYQLKCKDVNVVFRAASALIEGGFSHEQLVQQDKERGLNIIKSLIKAEKEAGQHESMDKLISKFNDLLFYGCTYPLANYVRRRGHPRQNYPDCKESPLTIEDLGEYLRY